MVPGSQVPGSGLRRELANLEPGTLQAQGFQVRRFQVLSYRREGTEEAGAAGDNYAHVFPEGAHRFKQDAEKRMGRFESWQV